MEKIIIHNRDGANLWVEITKEIEPHIWEAHLKVDDEHQYCLEYIRCIGDYPNNIEAVDPSGGPMLSLGDEIGNYKIVKILNPTTFLLNERDNN